MKFAEGWTQEIRSGDGERDDLLSYISDTHKSVYGYRPRGWETGSWSIEDLRAEAKRLAADVVQEIERAHSARAREAAEQVAHHLAYAAAFKPAVSTHKPFANLKEMVV